MCNKVLLFTKLDAAVADLNISIQQQKCLRKMLENDSLLENHKFEMLIVIIEDSESDARYARLSNQQPQIVKEEKIWLISLIDQSIEESTFEISWAALFLTLSYKSLLVKKANFRINPNLKVITPSPFVYAMQ